ncbi:MAG: hypothetical protein ACI9NY_000663, partial [Kiritimatiellia bacterium]
TPNENKGPSLQARCRTARVQKSGNGKYLLGLEILEILAEKSAQVA